MFALFDSINKPKELIDRAVELGLSGIAITDHSCLGAHVVMNQYAQEVMKEHPDFKVALGEESYLCDTRDKNQYYYHQIFVAKNKVGHKMLRELSSKSWELGYYDRGIFRTPILYKEMEELIEKYGKGNLIAQSACLAGTLNHNLLLMIRAEQSGNDDARKKYHHEIVRYIRWMEKWFGDDFYLEVAPGCSQDQLDVNARMVSVARAFNKKIVVGCDAHYLSPAQREAHKVFLNSKSSSDREVDDFYYYAYLQSDDECREHLDGTGIDFDKCVENSHEIYNKIENYSLFHTQQVPQVPVKEYPKKIVNTGYPTLDYLYSSDEPQERYWINRCVDELDKRGLHNETYMSRLEEEADTQHYIGKELDTCIFAYSNLMEYCIDKAWEVGSCVGVARGSGGAGLNHYLLGITQIDPIKYNLNLYFRFLNKERVELPEV